jgi:isopenicillin N synthase-like dioxygenase
MDMDNEKMSKANKIILGSGIAFTSFTLLATIISAFIKPEAIDPKKLSSRTKISYMATKQFARLPEKEKENYIKKLGRTRRVYRQARQQLSDKERQAVRKNMRKVWRKRMKERVNKFFKMSPEEQNKYLDEMIARRERWRKAREARRAQGNNNNSGNRSGNNSSSNTNRRRGNRGARRQGFLENTDSTTRAQMMELRRRMRERRQQTQAK